jgi:hypothetical protein
MNVGAENRTKLYVAIGLMTLAAVLLGRSLFSSGGAPEDAAAPAPAKPSVASVLDETAAAGPAPAHNKADKRKPSARSLDPRLRYDWLKLSEDTEYKGSGRNIFEAQAEIPKPITPGVTDRGKRVPPPPPQPTGPPPPPPIELKFFGFASRPGEPKKVFLSQGDSLFVASEGDIIDRRYKILRITPTSVEVEDVLNNNRQEIFLNPS